VPTAPKLKEGVGPENEAQGFNDLLATTDQLIARVRSERAAATAAPPAAALKPKAK
jgi:hypothetical protein